MINSHLLYRLSYRGTITFQLVGLSAMLLCKPPSEARHFTVLGAPVNRKNAIYYNALRDTLSHEQPCAGLRQHERKPPHPERLCEPRSSSGEADLASLHLANDG
jgi:hypothetical protein